jgi:hypothetical protein
MSGAQTVADSDAWPWWQARRLRYNIALGISGWAAYGANALLYAAFGKTFWKDWQSGIAITLLLGTLFLIVMGLANVSFLLGPWTEKVAKPEDVAQFRRNAWAMGFYGSMAVPFLFPLLNLAMLIATSGEAGL